MRALSAFNLLRVWEQGEGEPGYQQALLPLRAACPEESLEQLSGLSIGSRDARLLALRKCMFGRQLDSITACPACRERLEFSMDVSDLGGSMSGLTEERFQLAMDQYMVDFRSFNTRDLVAAAQYPDDDEKYAVLMKRCVLDAHQDAEEIGPEKLPPHVLEALAARIAQTDPQADVQLALVCPTCAHRWDALFDIVSFFWSEIRSWAIRLLREVHVLASVYGWREADILAMTPLRRSLYLELATG